ncbi:MAG TPA: hypothetical protein VMM13_06625, partial [Euzebya sp.]|nr:hypothetical protein [Euzebya sp.]
MTRTTDALRALHPDRWQAATRSPFLEAAGDGTLQPAVFDRWLEQDHHFVQTLVRAWGLMLQTAPPQDLSLLVGGMHAFTEELAWFEGIATTRRGDAGLDLTGPPLPATQAYDHALLRLAARPYPEAVTAMWAVEATYLSAWQHIAPGHPRFTDYITHWADEAFAAFVAELGAVVDRELPDGPTAAAAEAFAAILDHEAAFWA